MNLDKHIKEFNYLTDRKSVLLNQKLIIDEELSNIKHKLKINEIKIHKLMD